MSTLPRASANAQSGSSRPLKLRILDKEVQIACRAGEEDDLLEAAAYIDDSMRDLRRRSHTSSIEKIAIAAAINTANALLKSRAAGAAVESEPTAEPLAAGGADGSVVDAPIGDRIATLNARLDELLNSVSQSMEARRGDAEP